MRKLSELLGARGIQFPADERHIMCLPHVLNTCSKHVAEQYLKADLLRVPDVAWIDQFGQTIDKHAYIESLQQDPINCARRLVKAVRASCRRREEFASTIQNGNEVKLWVNEDGERMVMPDYELLRDVQTRWDSIYTMIYRLQEMRQVPDIL